MTQLIGDKWFMLPTQIFVMIFFFHLVKSQCWVLLTKKIFFQFKYACNFISECKYIIWMLSSNSWYYMCWKWKSCPMFFLDLFCEFKEFLETYIAVYCATSSLLRFSTKQEVIKLESNVFEKNYVKMKCETKNRRTCTTLDLL